MYSAHLYFLPFRPYGVSPATHEGSIDSTPNLLRSRLTYAMSDDGVGLAHYGSCGIVKVKKGDTRSLDVSSFRDYLLQKKMEVTA